MTEPDATWSPAAAAPDAPGPPGRPAGAATHVVVMGVSGTGKSTVGAELARRLGRVFLDGDDLHPPANVAAMAAGVPLTDADRWAWLAALRNWMSTQAAAGAGTVVACSALRRAYRDVLREAGSVVFAHLHGAPAVVERRVQRRTGHFMPAGLLRSQYDTLEPLADDEHGFVVDVDQGVTAVVAEIARRLTA